VSIGLDLNGLVATSSADEFLIDQPAWSSIQRRRVAAFKPAASQYLYTVLIDCRIGRVHA
jgi:hypothetical protein